MFVSVGLGVAGLVRLGRAGSTTAATRLGPVAAIAIVVALAAFNLTRQPPAASPDGGWPGGDAAAERVLEAVGGAGRRPARAAEPARLQVSRRDALPARPSRRGRAGGMVRHAGLGDPPPRRPLRRALRGRDRRASAAVRQRTRPSRRSTSASSTSGKRHRTAGSRSTCRADLRPKRRGDAADAHTGPTRMRTPAPQTPAFAVPETRTWRAIRVVPWMKSEEWAG